MAVPRPLHPLHPLPLWPAGQTRPAGAPGTLRRAGRAWPALALAAAVLGSHAWLAALLVPGRHHAGLPTAAALQVRTLPPAVRPVPTWAPAAMAPTAGAAAARAADAAAAPGAAADPRPPTATMPLRPPPAARAAWPSTPGETPAAPADAPLPAQPADTPGAAAETAMPALPATAGFDPAALAAADADSADSPAEGEPPPLYPTRLPPPVQLRYALQYHGRSGEALLTWQHDGRSYQLTLDGRTATGQPLVVQASAGTVDSHGLAPDRYTDRRRAGRLRAANFRRDAGHIGYSGAPQQHPAWPGAQDRLSWLAQLAAILAAAEGSPAELKLFVVDALGHAGLWQFQRQPDAVGPSPWGALPQQHWLRTPRRPEGLRIDVWLPAAALPGAPAGTAVPDLPAGTAVPDLPAGTAAPGVPAGTAVPGVPAGPWPLRLRFAVPRSGDVFELHLLGTP